MHLGKLVALASTHPFRLSDVLHISESHRSRHDKAVLNAGLAILSSWFFEFWLESICMNLFRISEVFHILRTFGLQL